MFKKAQDWLNEWRVTTNLETIASITTGICIGVMIQIIFF